MKWGTPPPAYLVLTWSVLGCNDHLRLCSFATGCILRGGRAQCLCKPGYAGASCER